MFFYLEPLQFRIIEIDWFVKNINAHNNNYNKEKFKKFAG